jgi:tRNA (Thr-GGU) A37 N-methylase
VIIVVEGVDMLDGTPLLDIKPYVPTFDAYPEARSGWFDRSSSGRTLADGRYG